MSHQKENYVAASSIVRVFVLVVIGGAGLTCEMGIILSNLNKSILNFLKFHI